MSRTGCKEQGNRVRRVKYGRRLCVHLSLVVFSTVSFGHGGFQCLAQLEDKAKTFAQCGQQSTVCDKEYQAMAHLLEHCTDLGFSKRKLQHAVNAGYAQVPYTVMDSYSRSHRVNAKQLNSDLNWHRFRQTFGAYFDHNRQLLSEGFNSARCGGKVEGKAGHAHWLGRVSFQEGASKTTSHWDFFEYAKENRCYELTSDALLVANIPDRYVDFYQTVLTGATTSNVALTCDSQQQCRAEMDEKRRAILKFRTLQAQLKKWQGCEKRPSEGHCLAENWRGVISELRQEAQQVLSVIYRRSQSKDGRS